MGNYRFRLSDMIPNAWFYKLKDMNRSRKQYTSQPSKKKLSSTTTSSRKSNVSQQRYSYYFNATPSSSRVDRCHNSGVNLKVSDTHIPEQPRTSSKKRIQRKTIYRPSPKPVSTSLTSGCSCHAALNSVWKGSVPDSSVGRCSGSSLESPPETYYLESLLSESEEDDGFRVPCSFDRQVGSWSSSRNCKFSYSTTDIVIDVNDECCLSDMKRVDVYDTMISELELPRIVTKPTKRSDRTVEATKFRNSSSKTEESKANRSPSVKFVKEESIRTRIEQNINHHPIRKVSSNYAGIRLRANSPKISNRKVQACARKSVSSSRKKSVLESFAVVKASVDPQRDFTDSMMEMIVENNIREFKDLEDLLACYLSLNSKDYHDLIVQAFEQIWFNMTGLHL
ncbi:hypothetical protein K2173_023580 [Erythroxylum novogranatense]|uniref:Transcription repressor n=1 Tax=Erythroxylum novogranatense TaxID=1862640 RepID=A0AAV8TQE5_9ROSI|nr:hypothetical protein K2173_023580 [Erythroxylum novogranatense]